MPNSATATHSSAPPQIPGTHVAPQDAEELRGVVADLLERESTRFPGAQPVSFAREHISELQRNEYFMCEKTDGIRCLLFLYFRDAGDAFEPVTLLIDRKNQYFDVTPPLRIPYHRDPADPNKFLFNTVLDGELVHDTVPGQPKPRLVFYVFDCLAIDGENITSKPFDKRLGRIKEWIFNPYERARQRGPIPEPFRMKEKQMYAAYHTQRLFQEVLPRLPHGNDGLIFTCKNTPYHFGTDRHILKWKPPHENTIDFKLRLGQFPTFDPEDGEEGMIEDYEAMPLPFSLLVQHNSNNYQHFADLAVTEEEWENLKALDQRLDGRIIECYRGDDGKWRYKKEDDGTTPRWRDDKKDANHISTVNSVLESIENPVTERDLLAASTSIKEAVYRLLAEEKESKKRKFSEFNGVQ
ncbi:mRNA capping enzyme, alpha subunit [Aaosphaeria arxii CBS 175.79]|uniref:mRNA-capping enzyme subunit alpha n=1 Tax=Aaosphaeria arxii CBS 175.79 TaxID=1450172 RepID=A0A6A5X716_9PLEO|nr:mRNA capping enzyme, alpha subunit [Aaosphaeria arxii CBS 175.79]KAF2008574.1 mRNA capping enzyme, alpha subunit [Aaosphaeria arxii CBS 175.79]